MALFGNAGEKDIAVLKRGAGKWHSLAMLCVPRQRGQCLRQVGSSQLDDFDVVWTCRLISISGLKVSLGYMRHQAGLELLFMVVIDTAERERT